MSTAYYTQKDFEQIINKGISYSISMDVLNTIRKLEDKVKQMTAISAATVSHRHTHVSTSKEISHSQTQSQMTTDWKKPKSMATTMTIKSNSPMNQMKLLLNKLSATNFTKLKVEIIELWEQNHLEDGKEIIIFLSRTKEFAMSALYIELYSALLERFPSVFQPILDQFWVTYEEDLEKNIPGMAPEEESEEYLPFMKKMSELRGQTIFLAHWCRNQKCLERGISIIQTLLRQIQGTLEDTSGRNKTKIDEWTEQIFLWVKIMLDKSDMEKYPEIVQQFEHLGQINIKVAVNMTSRSKFKYQEIFKSFC